MLQVTKENFKHCSGAVGSKFSLIKSNECSSSVKNKFLTAFK